MFGFVYLACISGDYSVAYQVPRRSLTEKPLKVFFTGKMPFLSPNQQCQTTELFYSPF